MSLRKRMKLKQFAELNGIAYQTALKLFQQGEIIGIQLAGGTILVEGFAVEVNQPDSGKKMHAITYTRVASSKNKNQLQGQTKELKEFAEGRGLEIVDSIEEIAPAYSDSRMKFQQILARDDWEWLVVESAASLMKFGAPYLMTLLSKLDKHVLIYNESLEVEPDRSHDTLSAEYNLNVLIQQANDMARQMITGFGGHKEKIRTSTEHLID